MSALVMNAFHTVKAGNDHDELEDRVSTALAGRRLDGTVAGTTRIAVADGASDAYASQAWAGQLTESFVTGLAGDAASPPGVERADLSRWYQLMQERWAKRGPASFASVYDEARFRSRGSLATLLGAQLDGLDGPAPRWQAFALGDTLLFHVSGGELVARFPALDSKDFGTTPDGAHTSPELLDRMAAATTTSVGSLRNDDVLLVATDALAAWLLRAHEQGKGRGWLRELCDLVSPHDFAAFVDDQRACGAMENDDVTLLRVRLSEPEYLVVAL